MGGYRAQYARRPERRDLQERIAPWTVRGPTLWADLNTAQQAAHTAKTDDAAHTVQRLHQQAQLPRGQTLPPDTYQAATGTATSALTAAQQAWNNALTTAQGLKTDLTTAISTCVDAINTQAHTRFTPNPTGWSAFTDSVKGFIKDHVAALAKLSSILKTVSLVAGILALIPVIDIVAGPIAIAAGAAALTIDAATMWATGKYNPTTLDVTSASGFAARR
jgi:hypothetical protein